GNAAAMALLQEIGPDQNILSYAFNLRNPDGTLNTDLAVANRLNSSIYRRLSIKPGADIYGSSMVVSTTDFDQSAYGSEFLDNFKSRLGLSDKGRVVTVLRSVVMDPWVAETSEGSFIDVLARELRKAVLGAISEIQSAEARGY